jgi:hypothetical protein
MATSHGMGQYRYTGATGNTCLVNKSSSLTAVEIQNIYRDFGLQLPNTTNNTGDKITNFIPNSEYYLRVQIPKDKNYTLELTMKLVNYDSIANGSVGYNYQYLGEITISPETAINTVVGVAYYINSEGKGTTCIVDKDTVANVTESDKNGYYTPVFYDPQKGEITVDQIYILNHSDVTYANASVFYIGVEYENSTGNKVAGLKQIKQLSYATLNSVFESESSNAYVTIDLMFKVGIEATNLNCVWFEITRDSADNNIVNSINNEQVAGRYVNPDNVGYALYLVNNIIPNFENSSSFSSLSKMTINGNPGLMMIVNGEEMRIGPSGQFSFDAIPITSIGVASGSYSGYYFNAGSTQTTNLSAEQINNSFVIDYEYIKDTSTNS